MTMTITDFEVKSAAYKELNLILNELVTQAKEHTTTERTIVIKGTHMNETPIKGKTADIILGLAIQDIEKRIKEIVDDLKKVGITV